VKMSHRWRGCPDVEFLLRMKRAALDHEIGPTGISFGGRAHPEEKCMADKPKFVAARLLSGCFCGLAAGRSLHLSPMCRAAHSHLALPGLEFTDKLAANSPAASTRAPLDRSASIATATLGPATGIFCASLRRKSIVLAMHPQPCNILESNVLVRTQLLVNTKRRLA
jgi:hypothetical protein